MVCTAIVGVAQISINEVAWGGNALDTASEWIELVNTTTEPVDLAGWWLISSDGAPSVPLHGTIEPRGTDPAASGYYLLERDKEGAVPSATADIIYSGALREGGESLSLFDPEGHLIDSANLGKEGSGWFAGSTGTADSRPRTMERIDPSLPDEIGNWASARCTWEGAVANPFCGTPKAENSVFGRVPVAQMTVAPNVPRPGEAVLFDAGASGGTQIGLVRFMWDFGDGQTAGSQTATHVFDLPGLYSVTLAVIDDAGVRSITTAEVDVRPHTPPRVDFSLITATDAPSVSYTHLRAHET